MSTIPAKTIELNRNDPDGWNRASASPHMRVKLCARCPYAPRDLADHYDPHAVLHVCAKCDGEQGIPRNHYPRAANRRRECATILNVFDTTQRSGARSVTESLVSSGTTPGEQPSVQGNAPIASRPARTATADGCAGFKPPESHAETLLRSGFGNKEAAR
jgi:hypothetical protein